MNIALYIARRYLVSKSDQNAVNIINLVTFLVIVVGSGALFIVLSAFAGLKDFSLAFANSFDPDLKATAAQGKYFILTPEEEQQLDTIEGVAAWSREIEERVFLTHDQKNHVAWIKAVDENYSRVVNTDSLVFWGNWLDNDPRRVVAGRSIVGILGTTLENYSSPISVLAPKPGEGSILRNTRPYNDMKVILAGVYSINEDLDNKYVFANLAAVQPLLEKDSLEITGINLKLHKDADREKVINTLLTLFDDKVTVKTRAQLNDALYKMLNTENLAIYLIFTLVLIIALFNVVGSIIMMVLDKKSNLKTLYSLGVPLRKLRNIYFFQGVLVTAFGGLLGIVIASLLVWSQMLFEWILLTPSLPYPVDFQVTNVALVLATILILGIIASAIASARINKRLLEL